jgi:hypothetical protein
MTNEPIESSSKYTHIAMLLISFVSQLGEIQTLKIMTTSVSELWPIFSSLSYADKIQLIQLVLTEMAQENEGEGVSERRLDAYFDPRCFFGVSHQPKQVIDEYLESSREGWL